MRLTGVGLPSKEDPPAVSTNPPVILLDVLAVARCGKALSCLRQRMRYNIVKIASRTGNAHQGDLVSRGLIERRTGRGLSVETLSPSTEGSLASPCPTRLGLHGLVGSGGTDGTVSKNRSPTSWSAWGNSR